MGAQGQRYKLWSGIDTGSGGFGISVKEEISENVGEVRKKKQQSDGNYANFGKEVIQIICANGPQKGRPDTEKIVFMIKWRVNGTWEILIKSSFLGRFQWPWKEIKSSFFGGFQ